MAPLIETPDTLITSNLISSKQLQNLLELLLVIFKPNVKDKNSLVTSDLGITKILKMCRRDLKESDAPLSNSQLNLFD